MSYEQELGEFILKEIDPDTPHCEVKQVWFKYGSDWANTRAEKVIADLKEQLSGCDAARATYKRGAIHTHTEMVEKLASRDEMIEKLETALEMTLEGSECRNDEDCDHCFGVQVILELEDWKKTK